MRSGALSKIQAVLVVVVLETAISSVTFLVLPRNLHGITLVKIRIVAFGFGPTKATVVIGVNNTLVWTNEDPVLHTVTDRQGGFGSANLKTSQSFNFTFTTPGVYNYFCKLHPLMEGQVIVKP